MNTVYLLLGSNMGDSKATLQLAEKHIDALVGKVNKRSSFYKTAAWGNEDQPDFLNRIIVVQTTHDAEKTLKIILEIEQIMGRIRTVKNAPRVIDIDILFFNDEIIRTKNLIVPHPEIQNRRFVLIPMAEISPSFEHPVFHKSPAQLLAECGDTLNVQKN